MSGYNDYRNKLAQSAQRGTSRNTYRKTKFIVNRRIGKPKENLIDDKLNELRKACIKGKKKKVKLTLPKLSIQELE